MRLTIKNRLKLCFAILTTTSGWMDDSRTLEKIRLAVNASPLDGEWRYADGMLFCGTMRVCTISMDTDPSQEFIDELGVWMVSRLSA